MRGPSCYLCGQVTTVMTGKSLLSYEGKLLGQSAELTLAVGSDESGQSRQLTLSHGYSI